MFHKDAPHSQYNQSKQITPIIWILKCEKICPKCETNVKQIWKHVGNMKQIWNTYETDMKQIWNLNWCRPLLFSHLFHINCWMCLTYLFHVFVWLIYWFVFCFHICFCFHFVFKFKNQDSWHTRLLRYSMIYIYIYIYL